MEQVKKALAWMPWYGRKERVFVAHFLRDGLRIQPYRVYVKRGLIEPRGEEMIMRQIRTLEEAFRATKQSVPFFERLFRHHFVFLLDPGLAASIYGSVSLARDRMQAAITEADVENVISQGIWKMFDRERIRAALQMGIPEAELALSDVRVEEVRLDNHRVLDPIGFTARTISVRLMETLLPQPLLETFQAELPKAKSAFFAEGGGVAARAFSLLHRTKRDFLFLEVFSAATDVFSVQGEHIAYLDTVPWGIRDLERSVAEAFAVSETLAHEIIRRSTAGRVSTHFLRRLEKVLASSCETLTNGLRKAAEKDGLSEAYVAPCAGFASPEGTGSLAIPEILFSGVFRTRGGTRIRFMRAALAKEDEDQGRSAWEFRERSALMHFFFSSADDTLNKVARRRARWLRTAIHEYGEMFRAS
jgi:hypothetical protein